MNCEIFPVYKNDRYKILKTEKEDYFLIDTDDKKFSLLHASLALLGIHKVFVLTEKASDDLRVEKTNIKNATNRIYFCTLIVTVIYYFIACILTFGLHLYNSLTFILFYIIFFFLSSLIIRLYLSRKEKTQLENRINLGKLEQVQIKLKSDISFPKKIILTLVTPLMQLGLPAIMVLGFLPIFQVPLILAYLPILVITFTLLLGPRSAFTNKYTKIIIKEIN